MTKRILLGLIIFPIVAFLLPHSTVEARARVEPVYKPAPITVKGMTFKQVRNGVRKALFGRGWQMKEIKKGLIRATYTKVGRKVALKAVINIHFNKRTVRIKYYDSQDFGYNKAAGTIHTRFNSWVKNIEKDIRMNLGAF